MFLISFDFSLFLLAVLWLNWMLRGRPVYRYFLLAANFFFYATQKTGLLFLPLGVGISNYLFALLISRTENISRKKIWLWTDIVINLGFLAFFKYFEFLYNCLDSVLLSLNLKLPPPFFDILFPIGISFFTFQGISYCIDVYRDPGQVVKNPVDVLLFVSFFPTILSGPIMRARRFIPQIDHPDYDSGSLHESFALILSGLFKKLVISCYLGDHLVHDVFQAPAGYSSLTVLLAVYAYSIQIYCDFSGYSDIAIGVAQLMGYRIPENFRMPYAAANAREFWQHWHISLSTWLRDYLYIPLGGSRKGKVRKYVNLMLTMVLGGLWHGPDSRFVLWGMLHGIFLCLSHLAQDIRQALFGAKGASKPVEVISTPRWAPLSKFMRCFFTFNVVSFLWVFFQAENTARAFDVFRAIFAANLKGQSFEALVLPAMAAGLAIQFAFPKALALYTRLQERLPLYLQAPLPAMLCVLIIRLGPSGIPPFIYFQF
ncbi:MAG: MBOAT family O-acyltransferase [Syntrophobacteraceae bacterium]|nr:MBOAT family O-acyltransferase [Syntrophobacteraceae bacterium]